MPSDILCQTLLSRINYHHRSSQIQFKSHAAIDCYYFLYGSISLTIFTTFVHLIKLYLRSFKIIAPSLSSQNQLQYQSIRRNPVLVIITIDDCANSANRKLNKTMRTLHNFAGYLNLSILKKSPMYNRFQTNRASMRRLQC